MNKNEIGQRVFNTSNARASASSGTREDDVKSRAKHIHVLQHSARRHYVQPAFQREVVLKRLLLNTHGPAVSPV